MAHEANRCCQMGIARIWAIAAFAGALLAACGGTASGTGQPAGNADVGAAPGTAPGTTAASTTTVVAPGGGGGGGLDIGTQNAAGGALFFHDEPLHGETSVTGLITVIPGGAQGGPPPADTVVTLNGIPLVRAVAGGSNFKVDPAGPQPTVGADGFLHITASSASASAQRVLNLACPFAIPVTLTPSEGASLSGVAQVQLAWPAGSLPVQGRDFSAFGLVAPSVTLLGFDAATNVTSFLGSNPQPLAAAATGATLAVSPTTASAYMVELRYPGVFFIDGQTGGACGRTRRFHFAR